MSKKVYLKNYKQILNVVTDFNKITSKGYFEVETQSSTTIKEKVESFGKNYFEVEITRENIILHVNGFINLASKEYESVGIRVAKRVGEYFESVYPSTDIKICASEGTVEKLKEALIIADKI